MTSFLSVFLTVQGDKVMLFLIQQDGQGLIEYALILVLISIVVLFILAILGPQVGNMYSQVSSEIGGIT